MKKSAMITMALLLLLLPIAKSEDSLDINKKTVALSFDDGPSKYTSNIVDLLEEYNCSATFFVVGNKINQYQDVLVKTIGKGNEIGNHTYSHPWLTRLSVNETIEEIKKTNDLIYKITGIKPKLFRPSYGDINKKARENINMNVVMWNNDSNDWRYRNKNTIASKVIRNINDGDIILMHDTYKKSYDALKIILPKLIEMDYQVVTISQLREIQKLRNEN